MRSTWRALLYYAVALANILTTLLPIWPGRFHLLTRVLPLPVILVAQHVTLIVGICMLLLVYPAVQGHRRAAHLLAACAAVAVLSNLLKGLDLEESLFNLLLVVALWRRRHLLREITIRYTPVDVLRLGLAFVVLARLYALLGHGILVALRFVEQGERAARPMLYRMQWMFTAKLTVQQLWLRQERLLLPAFLVLLFVAFSWNSLVRVRSREQAGDIYERFGRASHNSLAYLARRSDVSTFVEPGGRGAITYRTVGRVALQIGAILAPEEHRAAVYAAFRAFCRAHGLRPAAVALTPDERAVAQATGMRTLPLGNEAEVDLRTFAVEQLGKKLRWAQRSLAKRGYAVDLRAAPEVGAEYRGALQRIEAEWRRARGGTLHGCCMTLGRLPSLDDARCLIGLLRDGAGHAVAYLTLLPGGEGYYSLDLTRRAQEAPNAAMEFLLLEVLSQLRDRGAQTVSLNFSTLAWLAEVPGGAALLDLLGSAVQMRSLEAFNNKFKPRWVPRYLAFPSWRSLPDVLYAILVVEEVDGMARNALRRGVRRLSLTTRRPAAVEAHLRQESA